MAKGFSTFEKRNQRVADRIKWKRFKPNLAEVKAKLPGMTRELNDERMRVWRVDGIDYPDLYQVVAAHIYMFPQYDGKVVPPQMEVEHDPSLYANVAKGEWECECDEDFIHTATDPDECGVCGVSKSDYLESLEAGDAE